jgi:hypothetical protein
MPRDDSLQRYAYRCWVQSRTVLKKETEMNRQKLLRLAAIPAAVAAAAASTSALAVDPATAIEAVGTLSTSSAGFGPVMFGLAIAVVGIMIGVKWIKRAKGAA